jgi:hypothetical protein
MFFDSISPSISDFIAGVDAFKSLARYDPELSGKDMSITTKLKCSLPAI